MFGDFGQIKNITVEDNYLTGAGYLLYAGAVPGKPYPLPRNVAVRNNVFAPVGQWGWGPVFPAALDSASQAQWANNRLANGTTVQPPN